MREGTLAHENDDEVKREKEKEKEKEKEECRVGEARS